MVFSEWFFLLYHHFACWLDLCPTAEVCSSAILRNSKYVTYSEPCLRAYLRVRASRSVQAGRPDPSTPLRIDSSRRIIAITDRTGSFEVGPKNSLIETRSSGDKGVALGKVSLANRIKSSGVL